MASRLFVGNIPFGATEQEIRQHFLQVGPVSSVILPVDRNTGQIRGFAFVDFAESSLANEAIQKLNNQPFNGRNLSISEARPKGEGPPAGSRGPATRSFTPRTGGGFAGGRSGSGAGRDSYSDDAAPRKNFGPDRRRKPGGGKASGRGEWAAPKPKGPMREINTGRIYGVEGLGNEEEEIELFPKDEPIEKEEPTDSGEPPEVEENEEKE